MTDSVISRVHAWEALDSRGRPTVACRVETEDGGQGRVVVPSGASTGTHEAVELRDRDERYDGFGVRHAVNNVNEVLALVVLGMDAQDQHAVDTALEECDGSKELSRLGANASLAVSLAALLAASDARHVDLWSSRGMPSDLPMPMVNIMSGGAHAAGAIDIQDVLVVPLAARNAGDAIRMVAEVRAATARVMAQRGMPTGLVADEGGLAAPLRSNEEALELVTLGVEGAGLVPGRDASLALDLAANQLVDGPRLRLRSEGRNLEAGEWVDEVAGWVNNYPVCSLEDVLPDQWWAEWATASARLSPHVQLVGDDLFVTDAGLLHRGIEGGIANSVLVKVNQAGTVTRAQRTLELARTHGYSTVVSARSGDTEDFWLTDLAVSWRSGQIKVGSTMRSERTAKWNRLLEIESITGLPLAPFPHPHN